MSWPAAEASSLDRLLAREGWETPELAAAGRSAVERLIAARVGGQWWAPAFRRPAKLAPDESIVLLVVSRGSASRQALQTAAGAIPSNVPPRRVIVHDAGACLGDRTADDISKLAVERGWTFIGATDPWSLLDNCRLVVSGDAEIGFLALLRGIPVATTGAPFYAGWGLTDDRLAMVARSRVRSLDEIVAAHSLLGTRYVNPLTGEAASFDEACAILAMWRRVHDENSRIAVSLGMSFWKRRRVGAFLRSGQGSPPSAPGLGSAIRIAQAKRGAIAVWAAREPPGLAEAARAAAVPVVRVEDGFMRSVGLGADFIPAVSLALDWRGMYFDPSHPSDLEAILSDGEFPLELVERARRLRVRIVEAGITKYNTGTHLPLPALPTGRRTIFVPGQVEDDRSVRLAGAGVTGNLDLLQRVRAANPDAFILYKPHPDVDAGHRVGAVPDADILGFADLIVRHVSSAALIGAVSELHTLTSLAGFEALLRDRSVTVYGQPFYAGWGLTTDLAPIARRSRRLSLDQLVAGTLILYPRYIDQRTLLPCGPELVIDRLASRANARPGTLVRLRRLQGAVARRLKARNPLISLSGPR